jgi:hypothetical protein
MLRLDVLAVLVLLVGIAASAIGGLAPQERRPKPSAPIARAEVGMLAPPAARGPTFNIDITPKISDVSGIVARANAPLAPEPGPNFLPSPGRVVAYRDELRRSLSVAKVICLARPAKRRPLSRR